MTGGRRPPPDIVSMAQAAFATFSPDVALAELVEDSLDDPHSDPDERLLLFDSAGLIFRITVARGPGDTRSVTVDSPGSTGTRLAVHVPGRGPWIVESETPGRWIGVAVPPGPVSFAVTAASGDVRTSWTRL